MTPDWRSNGLTALTLVLVSAAGAFLVSRITFGLEGWLWNLDLPKIHYPLAVFYHDALRAGHLPLWNDNLGLGFPLYAEGQIGAFYPPHWLIFQADPWSAMDLTRVVHLTLAGTGGGLLALRVSGSRYGAVLAACVMVMGGAIVTKLEWWNLIAAYGWLPWVLLPLAGRGPPSRWAVVVAGTLWGVQALAGHPPTWMLTGLAALVLLLRPPWGASIGRVAAFGLLGAAVGAAQLIPTAMLLPLSGRAEGFGPDELFGNAATPFDVLGAGFINTFLRTAATGEWDYATNWYPDGHFPLLEAGFYLGLPILGLAGVGAAARRGRRWLALAGLMVLIPVLAIVEPQLWLDLPILNGQRSPTRSYLVASVAIAVLAAIGVSRLGRSRRGALWGLVAIAVPVTAYVAVTVLVFAAPSAFDGLIVGSTWRLDPSDTDHLDRVRVLAQLALSTLWPLALELTIGLAVAVLITRPRSGRTVAAAVILAIVPLALLTSSINPLRPSDQFSFADSPFVTTLQDEAPHRVVTVGAPYWFGGMPDQLAAAGVPDIGMFSSLSLRAVDDLVYQLRATEAQHVLRRVVGIDVVATFGERCPGRWVAYVEIDDAYVCRVRNAATPPYWVPAMAIHPDPTEDEPSRTEADLSAMLVGRQPVTTVSRTTQRHQVTVDQAEPGWVYFDRAWWPSWKITVDGVEVPVHEVLAGQAVSVGPNEHEVDAELSLWEVRLGLSLGGFALLGAGLWIWWPTRWRRSASIQPAVDPDVAIGEHLYE